MDSFQETRRQIRLAVIILATIIPIGVIGFMLIEGLSLMNSIWLTVITLATVGYGDIYAQTTAGRIFTLFLILIGIGTVAYGLQATATFLVSPAIRDLRARRQTQRAIDRLQHHYIICGVGELVDYTVKYLLEGARRRQAYQLETIYKPLDSFLDRIFGDDAHVHFPRMRLLVRGFFLLFVRRLHQGETLLDVVVVITPSVAYATHLRENGLLVIEGDPSNDEILIRGGIQRAQALMVMLDSDTEALLSILTARSLSSQLDITAAALEEELALKMIRVGANGVITPYEIAGQFLNNATLRPAVSEFFNNILFSHGIDIQTTQINLWDDSPWIGQRLSKLKLRERFQAGVIGLRLDTGDYLYAPGDDYILRENEVIIAVASARHITAMQADSRGGAPGRPRVANWQRLPFLLTPIRSAQGHKTLETAEAAAAVMSRHYIICGTGQVARNAIRKLDPARPFIIISDDEPYTHELLERGFCVIHGNPASESVVKKAGIERALAVMVALDDPANALLAVLNCRALSKRLLITATAHTDELMPKLQRAGVDRVVGPLQVAAQFVLLATTRPAVSDFLQHVVYNYAARLETTELYMQDDSPWIGSTIESLRLEGLFRAGVLAVRQANGNYSYAPPGDHVLEENEVLIVVTPMEHSDELRSTAHGSATKRPNSLRQGYFETKT